MSLPIDRIISSFKGDFARPSRFEVFFPLPGGLNSFGSSQNILTFRCENAQIPGRTLATTEQRTYGPIEKFPYLTTYNDLDLTFIVDSDMKQKKLFDAKFSGDVDEHENYYAGFLNFSNQPTSGTENNAMPSRTIIFDCGTEQDVLFYHLHGHDYDILDHPHGHDYDKDEGDDLMDAPWNRNYEPIETKKDIEKRSLKSNLTYSPNSFHLDFACKKNSFFF